jgi:hypothetical protein
MQTALINQPTCVPSDLSPTQTLGLVEVSTLSSSNALPVRSQLFVNHNYWRLLPIRLPYESKEQIQTNTHVRKGMNGNFLKSNVNLVNLENERFGFDWKHMFPR